MICRRMIENFDFTCRIDPCVFKIAWHCFSSCRGNGQGEQFVVTKLNLKLRRRLVDRTLNDAGYGSRLNQPSDCCQTACIELIRIPRRQVGKQSATVGVQNNQDPTVSHRRGLEFMRVIRWQVAPVGMFVIADEDGHRFSELWNCFSQRVGNCTRYRTFGT